MNGKFVNTKYASGAYLESLLSFEERGKCPFCPEGLEELGKPILKRLGSWILTKNDYPYKNAKHHFLAIPEKHKHKLEQLNGRDMLTVVQLALWAKQEYKINGGGLLLRYGYDSGVTIKHFHVHLIVPDFDEKGNALPVYPPIG